MCFVPSLYQFCTTPKKVYRLNHTKLKILKWKKSRNIQDCEEAYKIIWKHLYNPHNETPGHA